MEDDLVGDEFGLRISPPEIKEYTCKQNHHFKAESNCFSVALSQMGEFEVESDQLCPYCVVQFLNKHFRAMELPKGDRPFILWTELKDMDDLLRQRIRSVAKALGSDGCTWAMEWYRDCGLAHDIAYRTGKDAYGNKITRRKADRLFRQCIQRE